MKKLFPLFILTFAFSMFAFSVSGQSMQEKLKTLENKNSYRIEFDKSKNRTRVQSAELSVNQTKETESRASAVVLGASFSFEGELLPSPDEVEFNLYFKSFCPSWCFQENHSLVFFTGIERIDLGEGFFNGKVGHGHGKDVTETMVYKLSRAQLTAIANAGVSEFQLGNYESVLNDDHKKMLKNMIELATY